MPRTHDDSWDLASSVGATATMVATSRALASRGPEPLLDDPYRRATGARGWSCAIRPNPGRGGQPRG